MNTKNIRVVFMGSPEFALPSLARLAEAYPVVGVVTQPDKPAGRGRQLTPPPVKVLAEQLGIPVIQPPKLRAPEAFAELEALQPDLIVVTAFGQILRQNVLDLPRFGCVNVHASLLPRWRGAAPIQAAILHGDEQTGVTIMRMDAGVDTGPILAQRPVPIEPEDNAGTLSARLAEEGANLLVEVLPDYLEGRLKPQPQDERLATYAPMLKKGDGLLDCARPAAELANRVRAYNPWPGVFFIWQGQPVKVHRARAIAECGGEPGSTLVWQGLPALAAAEGCLLLEEVQPAGKKAMPGKVFLNGARQWGQAKVDPVKGEHAS